MLIYYFSFLTFLLSVSLTKQGLYILSKNIHGSFTKLDTKPYFGIQECIEACNIDKSCSAFSVISRMKSNHTNCFISNGSGSEELDSGAEVWVKLDELQVSFNRTCHKQNELVGNCPSPFVELGDIPGCYYPAVNEEVTWQEAEDACQALDPCAHLISFDSLEVKYMTPFNLKILKILQYCGCNLPLFLVRNQMFTFIRIA